uniref:Uncharacterized protein n=1 Tax=Arundo donax TaxID=35708 RepID=A0A0A9AUX1_ARUDO
MLLGFLTGLCFAMSTKASNSVGIFLISSSTEAKFSQPAE